LAPIGAHCSRHCAQPYKWLFSVTSSSGGGKDNNTRVMPNWRRRLHLPLLYRNLMTSATLQWHAPRTIRCGQASHFAPMAQQICQLRIQLVVWYSLALLGLRISGNMSTSRTLTASGINRRHTVKRATVQKNLYLFCSYWHALPQASTYSMERGWFYIFFTKDLPSIEFLYNIFFCSLQHTKRWKEQDYNRFGKYRR